MPMDIKKERYIKGAVSVLLCACILCLSSCSLISQMLLNQNLEKQGYYTEYGIDASLKDGYTYQTEQSLTELLDLMEELVLENDADKSDRLIDAHESLEEQYYLLSDHCDLLYVDFCRSPDNKEISSEYERISALLTDVYARISSLYGAIYKSTLGEQFYDGWSDEEIEEVLFISKLYSEEFAAITKERDRYVQLYEQLNQSGLSFKKKSAAYYEKIVEKNRELAMLAGFESYPAYADEYVYSRDYGEEEIANFSSYVKEYVVPLGEKLMDDVSSSRNYFTLESEFEKLSSHDMSFMLMKEKLTPYYVTLGSNFEEAFGAFDELAFTAQSDRSLPAAFTAYQQSGGTPFCYFGPGYQSLSTYVHEQGHFMSFYLSESSVSSIDLCETHSQANEWLYLSYMEASYAPELYNDLISYYLLDQVLTITLSCCCDAFERSVYADEELTAEDYDELFVRCAKELGAYEFLKDYMGSNLELYWHRAVISNSMYYLSYAVSLIPSIEFYLISKEKGFEYASELYYDLCTVDSEAPFHRTVTEAGLSSPFEEDVYEKLFKRFS